VQKNENNTVDLIYNITLNKKQLFKKINFSGIKYLNQDYFQVIIVTEENKFWKFLSKKNI
jgi:outer membrane protein assembly factor BamA